MRGDWDSLNRRLTGALLALDLHDSLVIAERVAEPRRRLFRSPAKQAARRFVQITATQRSLLAECVGSTSFGGDWEMAEEVEETLLRQGWEKPWSPDLRTFQREAALMNAPRLALAAVRALQLLGCEVADLEVELTREEPED